VNEEAVAHWGLLRQKKERKIERKKEEGIVITARATPAFCPHRMFMGLYECHNKL